MTAFCARKLAIVQAGPPGSGLSRLALWMLLALATGCVSPGQQEAARQAWDAHDIERGRECPGASLYGSCLGGGGP
ncbi:MAG TPA: hypothetical protein VMT79_02750 [Candidatus Binatia bacterium]|nr:hypothetical protein [Candidatus Binatia bacterium]